MTTRSQRLYQNGTLKKLALLTGVFFLIICFFFGKMLNSVHESITVILFIAMMAAFAVGYFLPAKGQKIHNYVPDGDTENYLDKDLNDPTQTFSQREQNSIQKYSWMSRVEYYNRHRRN